MHGYGLIFDLDGCLIDSSEVQKKAFFGSYDEVVGDNKCPSYEEYIKHTGDSVENVMLKLNLPIEMAKPFRRISNELIDAIQVNWEAIELIRDLRLNANKIAICTGKDRDRTDRILRHFRVQDCFDALVCGDDGVAPKPSPQPIITAMYLMQTHNANSVMIGDGFNDIISAKKANVRSILTVWYGDVGVPKEADYEVDSVEELRNTLNNL